MQSAPHSGPKSMEPLLLFGLAIGPGKERSHLSLSLYTSVTLQPISPLYLSRSLSLSLSLSLFLHQRLYTPALSLTQHAMHCTAAFACYRTLERGGAAGVWHSPHHLALPVKPPLFISDCHHSNEAAGNAPERERVALIHPDHLALPERGEGFGISKRERERKSERERARERE